MYHAFIRSNMDHVAQVSQPWLSRNNIKLMEMFQNRAFHIATGQLVSTPIEALRI